MKKDVVILLADDDEGHATLIKNNLKREGIINEIIHHTDGRETLDFLFRRGAGPIREVNTAYLLLLDIRMPEVSGIEVLRQIKEDPELCKVPVIMLTTTDDPLEVEHCHKLGCSNYIVKPVEYDKFVESIRCIGLFLNVVTIPSINGQVKNETQQPNLGGG